MRCCAALSALLHILQPLLLLLVALLKVLLLLLSCSCTRYCSAIALQLLSTA
jgi:hypothetical protein